MKEKDNRQQKKGAEVMEKALKVVFPVVAGLFANILMLLLFFFIIGQNKALSQGYKHFFLYYAHFFIVIAFLFQIFIIIPVYYRFKIKSNKERTIGIIALTAISVLFSLLFAFLVSAPDQTPFDFVADAFYSFIFIFVYWFINIHIMDRLCKFEDPDEDN